MRTLISSITSVVASTGLLAVALSGCASTSVPESGSASGVVQTADATVDSAAAAAPAVAVAGETKVSADPNDLAVIVPASELSVAAPDAAVDICVKMQVTGSKFIKRVCGTAEEWERMRETGRESRATLQKIRRAQ